MLLSDILGRTLYSEDDPEGGGVAVAEPTGDYDFDDETEAYRPAPEPETADETTETTASDGDDPDGDVTPAAVETGKTDPPVTATPPAPAPQPAAPQYDEALVNRAFQLGIGAHEVAPLLDKPALLKARVAAREHEVNQYWEQQRQAQAAQEQAQRPDRVAVLKQRLLEKGYAEDDPLHDILADVVRQQDQEFSGLQNHYQTQFQQYHAWVQEQLGQVNNLSQQHQQLSQAQQAALARQREAEIEQEVDKFFGEQPEEWQTLLGKERLKALNPQSTEFQNRAQIIQHAGALVRQGVVADRQQALRIARDGLFAEHQQTLARKRVTEKARNAQGQFTNKPSGSTPSEERIPGRDRAIREWSQALGKAGIEHSPPSTDPDV